MNDYPTPIATVDVVLLTLLESGLAVVLLERDNEPHAGRLALPGAYVRPDEDADTDATAARVLRQKTGLPVPYLEQLYTFSGLERDPRGWSLSVAYVALVPATFLGGKGAEQVAVVPEAELPPLPFDHDAIVERALERLRSKSAYSSLPGFLLPQRFTLNELHAVYERVMGGTLNKQNFQRKIQAQGMIEPIAGEARRGAHRPAQLFRLRSQRLQEFDRTI